MKKVFVFLLLFLPVLVRAYEINTFTEIERAYIDELYGEEYIALMDEQDYYWIKNQNLDLNGYEIYSNNNYSQMSEHITTNMKDISISKSCNGITCSISFVEIWTSLPSVRSYDVVGARLSGVNNYNIVSTKVKSSSGTTTFNNYKNFTNGFGCSVKLPTGVSSIRVVQYFTTSSSGTIYGSYQHATSSISLANSKKYTLGSSGMGSVFLFNSGIGSYYDNTPGVSINL